VGIDVFARNIGKVIGEADEVRLQGLNISSPGSPPPVGTKLILDFALPTHPFPSHISAYGEIVRVRRSSQSDARPYQVEVRFLALTESDGRRIESYLDQLERRESDLVEKVDSDVHTLADFINLPDRDLFAKTRPFWGYIENVKSKGYYIYRKFLLSPSNNRAIIFDEITGEKKEIIMMGNSNYLGLASHPKVVEAAKKALEKYGTGPVGSPLHTGSYEVHRMLEEKLAGMKGCEDAMTFSSGYTANLGCISALVRKGDCAIIDRLSHASIIDGCVLSGGKFRTFKHSDMDSLRRVMEDSREKCDGILVVVDGVYSTDGDIAPLPEIVEIAAEYDAKVMVDDAHATGVVGPMGKGTVSLFNLEGKVDIVMGTLSKALAGVGGFVASTKEVINYLRHYARSAFFSASIPPSIAASVLAAIEIMESEPERHENLHRNVDYMKRNLMDLGFNVIDTQSALISVIIGDDLLAKKMSKRIFEEGVYLSVFPYPAVPRGQERLRLSIMATHTREDLDTALEIFDKVGREFGIIGTGAEAATASSPAA